MNMCQQTATDKGRRAEATVIVYRSELLPNTQTFVRAQVNAVEAFSMQYAGLTPLDGGLSARPKPILLCERNGLQSRLKAAAYKVAGYAPRFKKKLSEVRPVLMHAHFLRDGVHALPLARALDLPLVVTLHGHLPTGSGRVVPNYRLDGMLYRYRLPALWAYASKFICVSEFIREKALGLGFPEKKLCVHYIGIDLDKFGPVESKRDGKKIIFVGRLVEKKGCAYLLEAMRMVQKEDKEAHLVIIGDGPDRRDLEERARTYGLRCSFLGRQGQPNVFAEIASARVFCAPSVTASDDDAEALGMVFAEAQAVGTPVVSFRSGGIPEVVQHEVTGLLAPEKDEITLTTHLLRFLRDDIFHEQASRAAVAWVHRQFDIRKQTRTLENIYSQCIEEHADLPIKQSFRSGSPLMELPL